MKNIITIMTLFIIALFSLTATAANIEEATPVPEVIACESEGTCEMTTLAFLLKADQEGLVEAQKLENANVQK
jgi:hypothetical protein